MKLTIDASVAVKWFVHESLHDEARLLLERCFNLNAPDILLAEFANVIWKKVRRREIASSRPYMNELSSIDDIITLYPVHSLVIQAARLAELIDHPVYDCLYLACAEATGSILVTADRKFTDKVLNTYKSVDLLLLGSERFVNEITAARLN